MAKIKYLILLFFCFMIFSFKISAEDEIYINPETGYEIYILDEYDLLNDKQEKDLLNEMIPISEFGGVAFVSIDGTIDTNQYARAKYADLFGDKSGTLFIIDMGQRNIWIHSKGTIYKTITKAYANTITDNVYKYASDQQYFECAANVFRQEYTLLQGGRIARPMKHITNAIISFIAAILINFVYLQSTRNTTSKNNAVEALEKTSLIALSNAALLSKTRRRVKQQTSYSSHFSGGYSSSGHSYSSHSSHSSSSHSSSGSSRGGGGGHKF